MSLGREIAWAAGLFEGEGSISNAKTRGGTASRRWTLSLGSTDLDVLHRFERVFGGQVYGPYQQKPGRKPIYQWRLYGAAVFDALLAMLPDMGARRRSRAEEALRALAA